MIIRGFASSTGIKPWFPLIRVMKKILISLPPRQESVIRNIAKTLELSFSELIRRILDEYLECYEITKENPSISKEKLD